MRGDRPLAGMTAWGAVLLALVVAAPHIPPAAAHHTGAIRTMGDSVNETIEIPANNYTAYEASFTSSDRTLYYVAVTNGTDIDLYILSQAGFSMYRTHPVYAFAYHEAFERSRVFSGLFTGVGGTVYFVVDNVDLHGATPTGTVTVTVRLGPEPKPDTGLLLPLLCGMIVVLPIAVGVAVWLRQRKRRAAAVPPRPTTYPSPPTVPPPARPPPPPPPPDD